MRRQKLKYSVAHELRVLLVQEVAGVRHEFQLKRPTEVFGHADRCVGTDAAIETAMQIKNQAEGHAQFAKSMQAVSRSIGEMFDSTNLAETQRDFERAMVKAETLEQQMDIFLDMTASSMLSYEGSGDDLVSDEEIDSMIQDEVVAEESTSELDQAIADGLADVRKELGKEGQ